jgi:hypothetical protein
MYRLPHDFNVTSTTTRRQPETLSTGYQVEIIAVFVDFETRDEAKRAQNAFDGRMYDGRRLAARPWQIPLKYMGASWDTARGE